MRCEVFWRVFFSLLVVCLAEARHGAGETDPEDPPPPATPAAPPATTSGPPISTSSPPAPTSSTTPSSPSTPTISSSAAPSPTQSPTNAFTFTPPLNLTTCTQANITWTFSGNQSTAMSIVVTNERSAGFTVEGGGMLVSRTLSTTVQALTSFILWDAVDIPSGQYSVIGFDTSHSVGIFAQSSGFFVVTGTNTSCLQTATQSPSSQSSSHSRFTGAPSRNTGVSDTSTSGNLSSQDSHNLTPGALAGTIAGVFVAVIGILAACILPRVWKRRMLRNAAENRRPYNLF